MTKTPLFNLIALAFVFSLMPLNSYANWKKETRQILKDNRYACRNSELAIDEIVADKHIKGHIKGLPQDAIENFKVIFYVKTNRWYAHPFFMPENPQEGVAYAKINDDGTFEIQTVRRQVPASRLAVSVVPAPYVIKSRRSWLKPFLGLFGGVFKFSCRGIVVPVSGEL
jgi:hypothetical protein